MTEQRSDFVTREILQRMVDEAAEKGGRSGAVAVLNSISVHDMATKEGQEALRADWAFAHQTRVRCERIKDKTAVGGVTFGGLIVLYAMWDRLGDAFKGVFK